MDEQRIDMADELYRRFLAPGADELIEILNEDVIDACKERLHEGSKDVFAACQAVVKGYLAQEPFREFEESMYFHRYLQWKWLERDPPTAFHFYRVLPSFTLSYRVLLRFSSSGNGSKGTRPPPSIFT